MNQLYPPGPVAVDGDLAAPGPGYRRRAQVALLSLLLFIALYLSLTAWFAWTAYGYFADAAAAEGKGAFIGFGLAAVAAFLTLFLVKALFFIDRGGEPNDIEVSADEQPQLFEFLYRLADEAGAPRPHRVFLSGRVNAAVFYDLSLLNLLFPSKKNLEIGLALVNSLTLGELKAVLAHEFGHFRQGSMAVGRWVYIAQQVATHIIQERDFLDRFLLGLSRFDIRIAWVGWILRLIVWALRAILDTAFSLVVLAQRSLSREMEFHADLVSVSLTGSDALVHALHRLHAADDAWERALGVAGQELGEGRAIGDIFVIQKIITQRMKDILDDEHYDAPPPLPETDVEHHRVFETEHVHPPRMWSTHPPNRAREDNAKQRYVAAAVDGRPAWDLFVDAAQLRERMTAHILKGSPDSDKLPKSALTDTVANVNRIYGKVIYDRRYRGAYVGRSVVREFATVGECFSDAVTAADLQTGFASLYPEDLPDRIEQWRNLEKERAVLRALYDGSLTAPDGVIRHRGVIMKRRRLPAEIKALAVECNEARLDVCEHDRLVRGVHRAAATAMGNGWSQYHTGLVALLHYADHTEANLADAYGRLNNLWSVVMADGKVSNSEIKELLAVTADLYAVMHAIDAQKGQVRLCDDATVEMGVASWRQLLDQEFTLAEPNKKNIGEWLNVVDGWVSYFSHALSILRQESLEALLAVEMRIEKSVRSGQALGEAPESAKTPEKYATLIPNTERKLQTKLGLWDRFQTADGLVPGTARFAVAVTIVGGLLGVGAYTSGEANVTVYNGLATPVAVTAEGGGVTVAPMSSAAFLAESTSDLSISARSSDGLLIESLVVDSSNSLANYVYNVAGAAPLVEWTAAYGSASERPPVYLGAPQWSTTNADFLFTDPPEQIEISGDSGTRDVLSGFADAHPQYLSDFLPAGYATENLVAAHARWDHANSGNILYWLAMASAQPDFADVLSTRLQRNPDEVLSLRFEQDTAPTDADAARICDRHTARAAAEPDNADWLYLSIRCVGDQQRQSDAFISAFETNPEHPWLAGASGYTYAERAQWELAESALDTAFSELRSMRPSFADTIVRVRRMHYGIGGTDMSDISGASPWVDTMLSIESGEPLDDPSLEAFRHLANGELEQAIEKSSALTAYADEILRFAAASDGASKTMADAATALEAQRGITGNTLWIALGTARRHGLPAEALLAQLDNVLEDNAQLARDLFAALGQDGFDSADAEKLLLGVRPETRGRAYAMGAVALGDEAPDAWRRGARRLLLVGERPYFR